MSKQYQNELRAKIFTQADEIIKTLPEFTKKFFEHMQTIGKSERTMLQYAYDLRKFFAFLSKQAGFKDIDIYKQVNASFLDRLEIDDIQEYLNTLNTIEQKTTDGKILLKPSSSAYKARNISSLRSFYNFYYRRKEITKDMASLIDMPSIKNQEKRALNTDQINRILKAVDDCKDKDNRNIYHRDKAILTLLFGTGIRVSELVGIDMSDINFYDAWIIVTRKGGDQDKVYFSQEIQDALSEYIDTDRKKLLGEKEEEALFISSKRKRMSVRMVQEMVSKYARLAELTSLNVTPHTARRSFGTYLYEQTNDIYLVAETLHHQSIQTTRRYAKMSEERKREAQKLSAGMFDK